MHLFALPLAFVLSLAPTGNSSRFELDLGGNFAVSSWIGTTPDEQTGLTLGGGAGPELTIFGKRVIDDDAPVSLQPYLQRVNIFHFTAGGSASSSLDSRGVVGSSSFGGGVTADAKIFLSPNLFLGLGFGVLQSTRAPNNFGQTSVTLRLPTGVNLGVRFFDAQLAVAYQIDPAEPVPLNGGKSSFSVPFWGNVSVSGFFVVRRRAALSARVSVEEGGASARVGVTGYFGRRLSLWADLYGGKSTLHDYGTPLPYGWLGGELGFFIWTNRMVGLGLSYSPTWRSYEATPPTNLSHVFSFTVRSRL